MVLAMAAGPAQAAGQPAGDPRQIATDVARDGGLQTDLPSQVEQPPDTTTDFGLHLPTSLFDITLWIALLCAAAVLAYVIGDILPRGGIARRSRWGMAADPTTAGPVRGADEAQVAADQLARDGRFVEAIHTLLLQSLSDVRKRLDMRFADSLTSREIMRRAKLPGQAELALRDIVGWVERAYFGTHPTGAGDYHACRDRYETFRQALQDEARA
jgi:hypothetical protein